MVRRMKLKKELRAVKEINEQERKKREDGRSDGESSTGSTAHSVGSGFAGCEKIC